MQTARSTTTDRDARPASSSMPTLPKATCATYLSYFKIDRTGPKTKRNLLNGGPPKGDAGAAIQSKPRWMRRPSSETRRALRCRCTKFRTLSGNDITDAYNAIVSDNKVDTANSSFGGCEALDGKTVQAWSAIAEQGAAKGITFHAATGDSGASLCASAPASSPYMVAVGGTALTVGTAWNVGARSRVDRQRRRHLHPFRPAFVADGRSRHGQSRAQHPRRRDGCRSVQRHGVLFHRLVELAIQSHRRNLAVVAALRRGGHGNRPSEKRAHRLDRRFALRHARRTRVRFRCERLLSRRRARQ